MNFLPGIGHAGIHTIAVPDIVKIQLVLGHDFCVITFVVPTEVVMKKDALLKKDHLATDRFLHDHAALIEKYLGLKHADAHQRFPVRNELAQLARQQFGYSSSTAASDIVFRIVKMYRKK